VQPSLFWRRVPGALACFSRYRVLPVSSTRWLWLLLQKLFRRFLPLPFLCSVFSSFSVHILQPFSSIYDRQAPPLDTGRCTSCFRMSFVRSFSVRLLTPPPPTDCWLTFRLPYPYYLLGFFEHIPLLFTLVGFTGPFF